MGAAKGAQGARPVPFPWKARDVLPIGLPNVQRRRNFTLCLWYNQAVLQFTVTPSGRVLLVLYVQLSVSNGLEDCRVHDASSDTDLLVLARTHH